MQTQNFVGETNIKNPPNLVLYRRSMYLVSLVVNISNYLKLNIAPSKNLSILMKFAQNMFSFEYKSDYISKLKY